MQGKASASQRNWITKLLVERVLTDAQRAWVETHTAGDGMTSNEASAVLDLLLSLPHIPPVATPGIYRHNGDVYLVKQGNNLYALALVKVPTDQRSTTDAGWAYTWALTYAPGVVSTLTEAERMSCQPEHPGRVRAAGVAKLVEQSESMLPL